MIKIDESVNDFGLIVIAKSKSPDLGVHNLYAVVKSTLDKDKALERFKSHVSRLWRYYQNSSYDDWKWDYKVIPYSHQAIITLSNDKYNINLGVV